MLRFGFLSTYPPTRCGLATFTEALASALRSGGLGEPVIVRVLEQSEGQVENRFGISSVTTELIHGDAESRAASIRTLNQCDVVIVQHEYGIYGGYDGDEVVAVMEGLTLPTIVVLHTVLATPTPHQKLVLERLAALATSVVVMSDHPYDLLSTLYEVEMGKVDIIPHGVPDRVGSTSPSPGRNVITWGLIGPGKGIEWGVRAMARLSDMDPRPHYTVIGRTHPKVLKQFGEQYREDLVALVKQLGLEDMVTFVDDYLDSTQLAEQLAQADAVLLPYDTRDQVTSGVLIEAVAAGKPVISTSFPHAVELLSDGAGIIVPHGDADAIAQAVRSVLGDRRRAQRMAVAASRATAGTGWLEVAAQYRALADKILANQAA
ncbi:glycosyltransferase [soil metagenome]